MAVGVFAAEEAAGAERALELRVEEPRVRSGGGMVELAIDVAPPSYAGGDAPVARPAGPPPRPWTQVSGAGSRRRLSVGAVQFEIDDELSVAHEMSCTPRGVHIDL